MSGPARRILLRCPDDVTNAIFRVVLTTRGYRISEHDPDIAVVVHQETAMPVEWRLAGAQQGVRMRDVCMRCGCARIYDTWAQDPGTEDAGELLGLWIAANYPQIPLLAVLFGAHAISYPANRVLVDCGMEEILDAVRVLAARKLAPKKLEELVPEAPR